MKTTDLWKNFALLDEISISGAFIYNGLRRYHEMRNLDHTDELFEFLYNISVGFERLLKIAIILFEHNDSVDQEELERSLITHNHLDLLDRLKRHAEISFGQPHIEFLGLLSKFYKTLRYDRFSLASVYNPQKERKALCYLLEKYLGVDIVNRPLFEIPNKERYRKFIKKLILKISRTLYKIIKLRAMEIGLYTYELRHGSKAESVFLREIDISEEDILWKELLIFFMNTKKTSNYLKFLRNIPPLDFDPELIADYLDCFKSDSSKAFVMDELEHHYLELGSKVKERLELMQIIGDPNVIFGIDEEEFGDDGNE